MAKIHTLAIEIHIKIRKRREVQVSQNFMREAVDRWVWGEPVEGVEITAISWTRDDLATRWATDEDEIEKARDNMLRRLLHRANLKITRVT